MSQAPATPAGFAPAKEGPYIVTTPVWCTVVRGFQLFFAFVIMVLAGLLIHGLAMDANVFGLVCGLFTFIIVIYALVTEKAPSAHAAYNIWAVLSLDLFMAILWLASMGANAALRTTFTTDVNTSCYNDGSAVNSEHCVIYRRHMEKRAAVATKAGLAYISAIAGLSALEMLLFIATLVFNGHTFRMHHQSKSKTASAANNNLEMGQQQTPMLNPNDPTTAPQYPQYAETQEYKPQVYPVAQPAPQPTPSPQPYNYPPQQYQYPPQQPQQTQYPPQQPQQPQYPPQAQMPQQHYQMAHPQQQPPTQPYAYPQNQQELPEHRQP